MAEQQARMVVDGETFDRIETCAEPFRDAENTLLACELELGHEGPHALLPTG